MPDEKRYILEDLEVKEVSVVDRGANKRTLLVVKNQDGDPTMADPTPAKDQTVAEDLGSGNTTDPVVEAQAEKAKDTTDLIVGLPAEMREAMGGLLGDVSKRISVLGDAVLAAGDGDGGVTEKFKSEVLGLSNALRMLVGAEKADDLTSIDKGVLMGDTMPMAQAYMQDAAPEYVMTEQGPMMKMPMEAMKAIACKMAMDEMYKAEEMVAKGDLAKACMCIYVCLKALGPFVPDDGGMPQQMAYAMKMLMGEPKMMEAMKQYAFNQPQPSIAAGVPLATPPANSEQPGSGVATTGEMSKAGRKIAGAKLSKLEELLAQLGGLVQELQPNAVTKADESTELAAANAKIKALTKLAKGQQAEINKLQSTRPTGHAAPPSDDGDNPKSGKVLWPDDLNDLNDDSDL